MPKPRTLVRNTTSRRLRAELLEDRRMLTAFELSSLLPENGGDGSEGSVLNGIDANDQSGWSVSGAGDFNGDGIDDVIVGARAADPNGQSFAGESYIVFGNPAGLPADLDLSSLDGSNGLLLTGIDTGDQSGWSVSEAGDFNDDGKDDVIIGAFRARPNGLFSGENYVVFGFNDTSVSVLDLSTLDGSNGLVINGIDIQDQAGASVSGAGDFNGDGKDDVVIGAFGADPNGTTDAGESYVVFGFDDTTIFSLELSALDGSNGIVINGIDRSDTLGRSVSGAGDFNGDGKADVIVGASSADPNGESAAGESYIVFGFDNATVSSVDLSNLDGSNGLILNGIDSLDQSGMSVSDAGDFNGDGLDDVIIGAVGGDPNGTLRAGEGYIVFGFTDDSVASLDLWALDGTNGLVLNGIDSSDNFGRSVSSVGDFNGDGLDDVIIGALGGDPNDISNAGESYIVFGFDDDSVSSLNLSTLDDMSGAVLEGIDTDDQSGLSVGAAGDFNGDGGADVIVGAAGADPNGAAAAGESYIIFGVGDPTPPVIESVDIGGDLQSFLVHLNDDDLNMSRATDAGNYRITAAGADGVFGSADDIEVAINSVEYDAAPDRVTVRTVDPFFDDLFRLEIDGDDVTSDGTDGVTDLAGNHLDGGDFVVDSDLRALSLVADLLTKTESLGLSTGAQNSLTSKLDATLHLLGVETANEQSIVAKLNAFVAGTNKWFEYGKISEAIRDELITDAEFILLGLSVI